MRGRLVAGIGLLAASACVAAAAPAQYDSAPWSELPAIVLVNSCGTGCVVQLAPDRGAAYVLTAAHVIAPLQVGESCPVRYWSAAGGGEETVTADVAACDPAQDAALLRLAVPGLAEACLATGAAPAAGQTVTAYGFQIGGHRLIRDAQDRPLLHVATGPVSAVGTETLRLSNGQPLTATMARIPFAAEGMSGGPVVDEAGRVVALLSGISGEGEGVATCGSSSLSALVAAWAGSCSPSGAGNAPRDPLRVALARGPGAALEPRGGLTAKGLAVPPETAVPPEGAPVLAPAAQAVQVGASASAAGHGPEPVPSPAVVGGVEVIACDPTDHFEGPALSHPGEARVAGRVQTAEGRPVRGVIVALHEGTVAAVAQVDPRGNEFDLGWLPAGAYELQLALERYPLHTASLQLGARTQVTLAWKVAR